MSSNDYGLLTEGDDEQEKLPQPVLLDPQIVELSEIDEEEVGIEMKASLITQIMVPVCITMAVVIGIVKTISAKESVSSVMVYEESSNDDSSKRFVGSLVNALIFVAIIIGVTILFVILYKFRCLKLIFAWLILSTLLMMGYFGGYLVYQILTSWNIPMDYVTFSILIWNFAISGVISIFWHSSLKVNQGFLIAVSVILAVVFTRLPEWTTWTLLGAIAVYDLFAVLCPKGPLRVLVETAQEREEVIPALIYNASVFMMMVNSEETEVGVVPPAATAAPPPPPTGEGEGASPSPTKAPRGVKLGLGDFVFYSVLVGRASMFDFLTVFASFIGIVTGLFCTILLLAIFRKALPALPISITFGILFYFTSKIYLLPFLTDLIVKGYVV